MTTDLTTITTPFGLLDEETQAQLRAAKEAGIRLEYYDGFSWGSYNHTGFSRTATYRLAPGQVWPKPEPKRVKRYVHLFRDGDTRTHHDPREGFWCEREIIARARVEFVEGQFDD